MYIILAMAAVACVPFLIMSGIAAAGAVFVGAVLLAMDFCAAWQDDE